MDFDENQKKAIEHHYGPCLVLAPAGSGKTRVLIERIKNLVNNGEAPNSILAITFTKKAQEEIKVRLKLVLGATANLIEVKTYHGLAYKYLMGDRKFIKEENNWRIIKEIKNLDKDFNDDVGINTLNNLLHKVIIDKKLNKEEEKLYNLYRLALKSLNLINFDLLLIEFYEKLDNDSKFRKYLQKQYKFLLIDECQDNNITEHKISKIIGMPENNIFWVGDDDQCIYTFAGSSVDNIFSIKKDFPNLQEIILQYNYRCAPEIVAIASKIISFNIKRRRKSIKSPYSVMNNKVITYLQFKSKKEEAESIIEELLKSNKESNKVGVLYRKKSYINELLILLDKKKIKYYIKDKIEPLKDKKTDILHSYLMCLSGEGEYIHFRTMLSHGMKYIRKQEIKTIYLKDDKLSAIEEVIKNSTQYYVTNMWNDFLIKYKETLQEISLVHEVFKKLQLILMNFNIEGELNRSNEEIELYNIYIRLSLEYDNLYNFNSKVLGNRGSVTEENCNVLLYTIHSSKGKEFEEVYLIGVNEGILPLVKNNEALTKEEEEEERRLCYVGITRAQRKLNISSVMEEGLPSRFIKEFM